MINEKTIAALVSGVNMSGMMQELKSVFLLYVRGYMKPSEQDMKLFDKAEKAARQAITKVLASERSPKKSLSIAGHQWRLIDVRFGPHSDETCDYVGVLTCDGEPIATASNTGQGGNTSCMRDKDFNPDRYNTLVNEVRKVVWLITKWKHTLYYDLDIIADECLSKKCYDEKMIIEI